MDVEERNMRELNEDIIRKTKVSQTLDKKTTAKELIPLMRADQSFNRYMSNMIYYSTMQEAITESQKVVKELKDEM